MHVHTVQNLEQFQSPKKQKYKESGQAKTFFFSSSKLGERVWKWSTVNGRNPQELHSQECLTRTRSAPEACHFQPIQVQERFHLSTVLAPHCPSCSTGSAPHRWLPTPEGQMQPCGTRIAKVYFSADSNIAQGWRPSVTTVNSVMWEYLMKNLSALSTH